MKISFFNFLVAIRNSGGVTRFANLDFLGHQFRFSTDFRDNMFIDGVEYKDVPNLACALDAFHGGPEKATYETIKSVNIKFVMALMIAGVLDIPAGIELVDADSRRFKVSTKITSEKAVVPYHYEDTCDAFTVDLDTWIEAQGKVRWFYDELTSLFIDIVFAPDTCEIDPKDFSWIVPVDADYSIQEWFEYGCFDYVESASDYSKAGEMRNNLERLGNEAKRYQRMQNDNLETLYKLDHPEDYPDFDRKSFDTPYTAGFTR